jgi:hypothetical protein
MDKQQREFLLRQQLPRCRRICASCRCQAARRHASRRLRARVEARPAARREAALTVGRQTLAALGDQSAEERSGIAHWRDTVLELP